MRAIMAMALLAWSAPFFALGMAFGGARVAFEAGVECVESFVMSCRRNMEKRAKE